jgi:ATP-dependent RNA helicase DDX5/DBP2
MQASGGMQMGSLSVNNPVPVASSTGMGLNSGHKHGHVDSDFYDQEQYKRPRTQAYGAADAADVDAYRRLHEVTAMGDNVPAPYMTFDVAGFSPDLLREVFHHESWKLVSCAS